MLDEAGLRQLKVVASGGLTEALIAALVQAGAPIDVFGVGADLSVSANAPCLDVAHRLTKFAGSGCMKLSTRKETMPGRNQIFRQYAEGVAVRDIIARSEERYNGAPLLKLAMRGGKRLMAQGPDVSVLRVRTAAMIASMPPKLRSLTKPGQAYPVAASDRLRAETVALRARLTAGAKAGNPQT